MTLPIQDYATLENAILKYAEKHEIEMMEWPLEKWEMFISIVEQYSSLEWSGEEWKEFKADCEMDWRIQNHFGELPRNL